MLNGDFVVPLGGIEHRMLYSERVLVGMRAVCTDRNFNLGLRSIALRLLAEFLHVVFQIPDSRKQLVYAFGRCV